MPFTKEEVSIFSWFIMFKSILAGIFIIGSITVIQFENYIGYVFYLIIGIIALLSSSNFKVDDKGD